MLRGIGAMGRQSLAVLVNSHNGKQVEATSWRHLARHYGTSIRQFEDEPGGEGRPADKATKRLGAKRQ